MKRQAWFFWWILALTAGAQTWRNPVDRMEFVWIPGGVVSGGGPSNTFHTEGFWMAKTEVTVAQFRRFVRATGYRTEAEWAGSANYWAKPGFRQTGRHPAVYLSARDAFGYARWAGVDLPTESEWLWACRGGTERRFYFGDTVLDEHVWHRDNSPYGTHPVATRKASPWGLYDLVGGVYEYCRPELAPGRVVPETAYPRGGSWTRCPDRIVFDLPNPPTGTNGYPVATWDDDRGFRCVYRGQAPTPRPSRASAR